MTYILKRSGHIEKMPERVIKLAMKYEFKYFEKQSDSEFQKSGSNMIEMANEYEKTRSLERYLI